MLLGGCSSDVYTENYGRSGTLVQSGGGYCAVLDFDDSSSNIALLDENLNVVKDKLIRDVFDTEYRIGGIFADGNYIYCSTEFEDSSRIDRINLTDLSEENIYFGDYSAYLGQTKYFDMVTVWSDDKRDDATVKNFFVSGGKLVMSMQSNSVYSLDISTRKMTYLFEDVEVNDLCTSGGKIYYTNLTGELICFDNGEKDTVSNRIFNAVCADESRVYGICTSGVFGYDSEFKETKYSDTSGNYRISADNGKIAFETDRGWVYIDENGEHNADEADNFFVCENGLITENNGKYDFYK